MMAAPRHDALRLGTLLEGVCTIAEHDDRDILGLCLDSRETAPGDLFVALRGESANGVNYIHDAVAAGAVAVLVDAADSAVTASVPVIPVPDLRRSLGVLASRYHGNPSAGLDVIAVTGTNGKTTVAHLVADALTSARGSAGYAGTLGIGRFGALASCPNTTPDPITLQALFAGLRDAACTAVAVEVSSHGIAQHRIAGTSIDVAIFTNLSHDHLDYHSSLEAYAATKKSLFRLPGLGHAVVNIDDPVGRDIANELRGTVSLSTYGLTPDGGADFTCTNRRAASAGVELEIATPQGPVTVTSSLPGDFNVLNMMAALAALIAIGIPAADAAAALSRTGAIPGRMQRIAGGGPDDPLVVVDYAHTPDSLERALAALRTGTRGALICVFGCGGDRDRSKRAAMGRIACAGADRVIITNDNPRGEAPLAIIGDILDGIADRTAVNVIEDRAKAIESAIAAAGTGDTVLVAGKGHERFQEAGGCKQPFSDAAVALAALQGRRQ